jgi:GGDEF domain-containing protein
MLVVDPAGAALTANRAWRQATGLSTSGSMGRRWMSVVSGTGPTPLFDQILTRPDQTEWSVQIDGAARPARSGRLSARALRGESGEVLGHVICVTGLTRLVGTEARRSTRPIRLPDETESQDPRAEAIRTLQRALATHEGERSTLAALLIDVEPRLQVDDLFVDPVLDPQTLSVVGARVREAAPHESVMAFGDHQFVVLVEPVFSYAEVIALAQKLVETVAAPLEVDEAGVSVSVGVAFPHLPGQSAEQLLDQAERASGLAQSLGGQRYEVVIGTGPTSSDVLGSRPGTTD